MDTVSTWKYGCQSMAGDLTRVLMRRPGESLRAAKADEWHYGAGFDAQKAIAQYEEFAAIVQTSAAEILWIDDRNDGLADAMFTRDASIVTDAGAVLLNMGKPARRAEPRLHKTAYEALGVPILGALTGDALIEGGDLIWLDTSTLVVGFGFRSNRAGAAALSQILAPQGITVLGFDLPVWSGADACLHLMSMISPLSDDTYLVFPKLIPAALWQEMSARGITFVEAPEDDFHSSQGLNLNVLPLARRACVMIDGFDKTKDAIEAAGFEVLTFSGDALCIACEGGPTCLTNPIHRITQ